MLYKKHGSSRETGSGSKGTTKISIFGYSGTKSDVVLVDAIDVETRKPVGKPQIVSKAKFFEPGFTKEFKQSILNNNSRE